MLNLEELLAACTPGGPSVWSSVTELSAAAGPHASITPAKYKQGNSPCFAFETRYINSEPTEVVVIDSIASSTNRGEQGISNSILDGDPLISRIPRIALSYGDETFTDIDLPHRFADGHIRAGSYEGKPVTQADWYREIRNSKPRNYRALLNTAPIGAFCTQRCFAGRAAASTGSCTYPAPMVK